MTDVMIDLETFDKVPGAAIRSIGLAKFNRFTGEVGETYYASLGNMASAYGSTSESTCEWWSQQSEEAQKPLFESVRPALQIVSEIQEFIKEDDLVWGNGSVFDISILGSWIRQFGSEPPWKFYNVRDVRTVVDLAGVDRSAFVFEGIPHHALHDALHQIKYLCFGINKLINVKTTTEDRR